MAKIDKDVPTEGYWIPKARKSRIYDFMPNLVRMTTGDTYNLFPDKIRHHTPAELKVAIEQASIKRDGLSLYDRNIVSLISSDGNSLILVKV